MKSLSDNSGTVIVESISAMALLALLVLTILGIAYFLFAKVTVSTASYESLICAAERQPRSICQQTAEKKIKKILPFGDLRFVRINEYRSQFRVNAEWRFFADKHIKYQRSLRY